VNRDYISQIKQLHTSLAKMELALGSIQESIIWVNKAGTIQWCNGRFDRLVGLSHIQILGRPLQEVLILYKEGKLLTGKQYPFYDNKTRQDTAVYEYQRHNKFQYIEIKSQQFQYNQEEPSKIVVLRDVTDLFLSLQELKASKKEAEQLAEKAIGANQLKSQFLANMSHELRTPLNAIIGFTELIKDEKAGPLSAEQKEYLGDVLLSGKHLLQLINDILDLSKIESGKMEYNSEPIHLNKLIEEVCEITSTLSTKKRIKIEIQQEPGLSRIVGDSVRLKQIIYNYLSNAIKFSSEMGQIKIQVSSAGPAYFRIEVQDNGIGISKKDLTKLFIEFQQLDLGSGKKFQGTGLGLALTRRLVEAQGGQVGVHSTLGQGSCFFAIMPRVLGKKGGKPLGVPSKKSEVLVSAVPKASTILVIEDHADDQQTMIKILQKAGYKVTIAQNGKEALKLCQKNQYDAITLDLILPDFSGWDLLHQVRTQGRNQQTPILVVTIVPGKVSSGGFIIHDYLTKPVKPRALLKALEFLGVPAVKRSIKILVIDDDIHTLKLAKKLLENEEYQVICEANSYKGLERVKIEKPQIIILDLMIPDLDGFEFLERLRRTKIGKNVPVIVWTVKDLEKSDLLYLQKTAQAVIAKGKDSACSLLLELKRCHLKNL
jgi:signal transduction histidine kinase/CheY-like chemotaxis protein